uniref:EGF-like domain-containing protein n=1 Tax=Globodera pallida TaxID=36090 RepID=A0A183C5M5_GLOPA
MTRWAAKECKGFDFSSATSCIPIEWVCDGQTDCLDMKDEMNCTNKDKKPECNKEMEFACDDGQCIYKSWRCDGDRDCTDGSDENGCKVDTCSSVDKFKCKSSDFCIPNKWKCDGEPDCPDHSDETDCKKFTAQEVHCKDHEFACTSHVQCISSFWVCDGDEDCFDGSDEHNCSVIQCKPKERACADKKHCIDEELWCDRTEDCADGSDEANCSVVESQEKCNLDEFMCPGEKLRCIKYQELCNGMHSNDCAKNGLCNQEIRTCKSTGTPDDACISRKMATHGMLHYCAKGYNASVIGVNQPGYCQDINECEQPGACDQLCTNLPGSYHCACYPGYKLIAATDPDKPVMHKCRAVGPDPLLLLANRAAIRQFDIITNKYHPLISKLESAVALDYWHKQSTLVWSDVSKEQIMICEGVNSVLGNHAMLDSINTVCGEKTTHLTIIKDNVTTPDGLAVDWVHGLLFWTDTGRDTINVYDLRKNKRKVLLDKGLDEPRAIATSNVIKWPNGLALDILDKRVYWADAKTKQISTCDYWGEHVRVILHSHQHVRHPFSLAVFEERLYWTDWDQEGVLSVNKFHGKDVRKLMSGVSGPMTVRVYHKQAQPVLEDKCRDRECDHLCLPRALYQKTTSNAEIQLKGVPYSCACDNGFRVDVNNQSMCVSLDPIGEISQEPANVYEKVNGPGSFSYMFVFFFLSVLLVLGYTFYRRRPRHFSVLHFDNPIYRRTVEADLDAELEGAGDNSLGPISILPVGGTQHSQATSGFHQGGSAGAVPDSRAKLVLNGVSNGGLSQNTAPAALGNTTRPEEYAYDQPLPKV